MKAIDKITIQIEKPRVQIALLILLCGIIYGQTLGFGYVFDDIYQFESRHDLSSGPLSWHAISKSIVIGMPYFRPLVMLTWFIEFHLFGLRPSVSHGINVFIFCCNSLLVRSVTLAVLKRTECTGNLPMRAWLAAVIYVVHPTLVEATAWVSGRFDLLCTLFILLAVRFFLKTESRALVQFAGVLVCSLLALSSKEMGAILIGTLLCVAMAAQPNSSMAQRRGRFLYTATAAIRYYRFGFYGVICSLPIYFIARTFSINAVSSSGITSSYLYYSFITEKLPFEAMRLYTGLTLLPSVTGISFFRGHAERSIWTLVSTLGALFLIVIVIWTAAKGKKWAWLILAGFTGLALVIHIIPIKIAGNIVQDRFLTMPLAFFVMAAVSIEWTNILGIPGKMKIRKFIFGFIFIAWLFSCLSTTMSILPVWKNNLLSLSNNYRMNPDNLNIRQRYIAGLFYAGRFEQIINILDPQIQKKKEISIIELFYLARSLDKEGDSRGNELLDEVMLNLERMPTPSPSDLATNSEQALLFLPIGNIYTEYAALKVSSGDIDLALHYANAGLKFIPEDSKLKSILIIMDASYLNGNFNDGWNAIRAYTKMRDLDDSISAAKQLALNYCNDLTSGKSKGTDRNKTACKILKKSDFFRVRDFLGPIP